MNPLDFYGPQFLLFYWATAVVVWFLVRRARNLYETGPMPRLRQMDPYLIAYLRNGANECARLAMFSLLDRGLLKADEPAGGRGVAQLTTAPHQTAPRHTVEKVVLARCYQGTDAASLLSDPAVTWACEPYGDELRKLGLLPGARHRRWRRGALLIAGGGLLALAVAKIVVGVSRERPVALLVVSTIIVMIVTASVTRGSFQTALGSRVLKDLQELFRSLRQYGAARLRPGGATEEALLLAAVFGMAALPAEHFPWANRLGPRGDAGSSSSCGSSCGGGDGGGGGCGGCGGGGGD